jgi:hypothetical protein
MKAKTVWIAAGAAAVWCLLATAALAEGTREHGASCAQEAKGLKGEERDKFLEACRKAQGHGDGNGNGNGNGHSSGHGHSQQEKMKSCNAEARTRDLHGDERRAFMSSCLRG